MKELWSTLPTDNPLRRRIEGALSADDSAAVAWMNAATIAWGGGYDMASEPPHTFADKLIELRRSDPTAAGRLTLERSQELADEKRAARLYAGKRAWAKGPPLRQIEAQRAAAKQTAELDAAVEARAQQLVAEQSAKNLEAARKTVRREMATK